MNRIALAAVLALLTALAYAAPAKLAPVSLHWDSWGTGEWHPGGLQMTVTPDLLTLTLTVGAEPDVWANAERIFTPAVDISRYGRLEYDVKMTSARGTVPPLGLSLLMGTPAGANYQQDTQAHRLIPGEWVHETIDLFMLPADLCANLGRFQFFTWNRDFHKAGYQAGDTVTFEIRNPSLTGTRAMLPPTVFKAEAAQRLLKVSDAASVWTEPADTKILPERDLPSRVAKETGVVRLESAANEYVDFQLAVRAKRALTGVKVAVSIPKLDAIPISPALPLPADRVSIRPEGFVKTTASSGYAARPGLWPDPLLMPGAIDVPAGETRAFWVRLYVPAKTPKGTYDGALTVASAAGKLADAKVSVKVFGFALTPETHLETAFQFSYEKGWSKFLEYYPDANFALFKKFWQSMAQHRLAPMHVGAAGPPRPADEKSLAEFERYVDLAEDLKFSHYLPFYWGPPVDTEADRQWIRQMTDWWVHKGVLDKTYVYMCQFDEASADRWPDLVKYGKALKAAEPRLKRMITLGPAPELYGAADIWCPTTSAYNFDLAEQRRKVGEKVWWYNCGTITPGLVLDRPGVEHRALLWLTWTQKADGLLYWCIDYWQKNPWDDPQMGSGTSGNGDGFFLYPRRPDDPPDRLYESVRWEILRDSIEDYEYFWTLRSRLEAASRNPKVQPEAIAQGRAALGMIEKVASGLRSYSLAPEDYSYVRHQIAVAIEALPK